MLKNKSGIKLGRAFNHLEDLVFFHGSSGISEVIQHLMEMTTPEGAASIRMKWDGAYQIYWGRERQFNPLIFTGHNGWSKGYKTSNESDLVEFITDKSGNAKTTEERKDRIEFAHAFADLYKLFESATPKDFVGFVYADVLFSQKQKANKNNIFEFCPNPKSQTRYHVHKDSALGNRIKHAKVMVAGHAYFKEFGLADELQEPLIDFSKFNKTSELIVQDPIYNTVHPIVDNELINIISQYSNTHASTIDEFLLPTVGLADLKEIIYRYVNQTAKLKQLEFISEQHFFNWLGTSKVSIPKQTKIHNLNYKNALAHIFKLVSLIINIKDNIISQIEAGHVHDITDSEGEGRVRYADNTKMFGHIKLVPRKRWTPK